jgi:hypothetical protein
MISTRRILLLALITGLISSSAFAAKNYYRWVDENGVTHYTARKPYNVDSEAISVTSGLPRDESGQQIQLEDEEPSAENESQATAASADNKDPERCEVAKSNLKILNESARVREKDPDGNFRYLSEEEKNERKKIAEQAIAESC